MKTSETLNGQNNLFAVSDQDFETSILHSELPVIVDFWGEWCPHCHVLAPVYQQLSQEYQGKLRFATLEIDENPETTAILGVRGAPTLIVFHKGKEAARIAGPHPTRLKRFIDKVLAENECL